MDNILRFSAGLSFIKIPAIEVFGVPILVTMGMDYTRCGIEGFGAKILISLIVTILNYFSSKLLVFKRA